MTNRKKRSHFKKRINTSNILKNRLWAWQPETIIPSVNPLSGLGGVENLALFSTLLGRKKK